MKSNKIGSYIRCTACFCWQSMVGGGVVTKKHPSSSANLPNKSYYAQHPAPKLLRLSEWPFVNVACPCLSGLEQKTVQISPVILSLPYVGLERMAVGTGKLCNTFFGTVEQIWVAIHARPLMESEAFFKKHTAPHPPYSHLISWGGWPLMIQAVTFISPTVKRSPTTLKSVMPLVASPLRPWQSLFWAKRNANWCLGDVPKGVIDLAGAPRNDDQFISITWS